jgi:uncharacterized caspase-like protein
MIHAVVVGIDAYKDAAFNKLRCARADAVAVAKLLLGIADDQRDVRCFLDGEATRSAIVRAIADDLPARIDADDIVLLYFAGHGSPERMGTNAKRSRYLIAHDTEFFAIHATGIDLDHDILQWLNYLSAAKLVVLVIDSCFSGAAGGRTIMGPKLAAQPTIPFLAEPKPISLRELDLGGGLVILCAADENQVAREDQVKGHGLFTYYLLDALQRPRATSILIDIMQLYSDVEKAVRELTAGAQEPVISVFKGKRPGFPLFPKE